MNCDCSAIPGPLPDVSMFLKTKEDDGALYRQLCACPHNGVQLCMSHVQSGKNFPVPHHYQGK